MRPIVPTDEENASPRHAGESWRFTAQLSPRPRVRVAAVDAAGHALNEYTGQAGIAGTQPAAPWAVYLADATGRYKLICFDLDAKHAGVDQVQHDAEQLVQLLTHHGLEAVVCKSGPSGGRHVWTALHDTIDAATVALLARLARHLCPSLDLAPLSNAATGCVRPPGAPHRAGGHSQLIAGDLSALLAPRAGAAQLVQLVEDLAQRIEISEPSHDLDPSRPLPLDQHGRPYLPGPRRPLPEASAAALREDGAAGDASAVLWRVLIGAAAARWHHSDVAALVETAPGLEHVRTMRDRGQRHRRRLPEAAHVLRRQWDKAVRYTATHPRLLGADPTFEPRAGAIAAHVQTVQDRARIVRGRWATGAGPADRRILDALCLLALQCLSADVEADTRRLALLAGVGRETARVALYRLAADGWIIRTQDAQGPHGAHWALSTFHSAQETTRSQADPRPRHTGPAQRTALLAQLAAGVATAAHDVFTPGPGLGLRAGNTYATITPNLTTEEISQQTGTTPHQTHRDLHRLATAGLIRATRTGWRRTSRAALDRAAHTRGVDGRLRDRARRYAIEREVWAWYQAEHAWMLAPQRTPASRRPQRGQLALLPDAGTHAYGPHPRRADGSLDWRQARRIIEHERAGTAHRRVRPATPAAA